MSSKSSKESYWIPQPLWITMMILAFLAVILFTGTPDIHDLIRFVIIDNFVRLK